MRVLPIRPDHVCSALLVNKPKPSDADIDDAMAGNICVAAPMFVFRAAIKQAAGAGTTAVPDAVTGTEV